MSDVRTFGVGQSVFDVAEWHIETGGGKIKSISGYEIVIVRANGKEITLRRGEPKTAKTKRIEEIRKGKR